MCSEGNKKRRWQKEKEIKRLKWIKMNKAALILRDFQYEYKPWKCGLAIPNGLVPYTGACWLVTSSLGVVFHEAWGVRKVTTGITGLWLSSVHSDTAFWSFKWIRGLSHGLWTCLRCLGTVNDKRERKSKWK